MLISSCLLCTTDIVQWIMGMVDAMIVQINFSAAFDMVNYQKILIKLMLCWHSGLSNLFYIVSIIAHNTLSWWMVVRVSWSTRWHECLGTLFWERCCSPMYTSKLLSIPREPRCMVVPISILWLLYVYVIFNPSWMHHIWDVSLWCNIKSILHVQCFGCSLAFVCPPRCRPSDYLSAPILLYLSLCLQRMLWLILFDGVMLASFKNGANVSCFPNLLSHSLTKKYLYLFHLGWICGVRIFGLIMRSSLPAWHCA